MQVFLDHPLFIKAKSVIEQIESHGYEAYFVGGSVRDLLLNRPIHDIDIATSALPHEIQNIFKKTFDVGIEHGTVIVIYNQEQYEITTFRTEDQYTDHRRPDKVSFVRNLKEDTLRRDFTINALALDCHGNLFDYHGGLIDLNNQLIRCVGHAKLRFSEDALRMLRAIRFASQLDFIIEENTLKVIKILSYQLQYISIERVRIEFNKFLTGSYFVNHFHLVYITGIGDYLPGFNNQQIEKALNKLTKEIIHHNNPQLFTNEYLVWARLLNYLQYDLDKSRALLRQWTFSNYFIRRVLNIMNILRDYDNNQLTRWKIYQYPREDIEISEKFLMSKNHQKGFLINLKDSLPIQSKQEIVIKGNDIIDLLNMNKGGPLVGKILNQLEFEIVHENLHNSNEKIIQYIEKHYK